MNRQIQDDALYNDEKKNTNKSNIDIDELYDDLLDMSSIINRVIDQIEEGDNEEKEKENDNVLGPFFFGFVLGAIVMFEFGMVFAEKIGVF